MSRYVLNEVVTESLAERMAQALQRRYARVKKGEVPTPDVLLIDGGRGQLNKAFEIVEDLHLIQQIRDEAHRLAASIYEHFHAD